MFDYFFEQLDNLLAKAKRLSKAERLKVNELVSYAVNITENHMGRYGTNKSDRPSQMLSDVWLDTSQKLLQFNHPEITRFARILKEKSSFWANPSDFDYSNPEANNMMIVNVKAKLKDLTQ